MSTLLAPGPASARGPARSASPSLPGRPAGRPGVGPAVAPAEAPGQPARHLRVVEARRRRWRPSPRAGLVATAAVFVALVAVAVCQTLLVQGQVRLDGLDAQLASEQQAYQRLRLEVARLEAPDRVVAAARDQLGMLPPEDLVYLSPTEAVTPPAAAAGPETAAPSHAGDQTWARIKPLLENSSG